MTYTEEKKRKENTFIIILTTILELFRYRIVRRNTKMNKRIYYDISFLFSEYSTQI